MRATTARAFPKLAMAFLLTIASAAQTQDQDKYHCATVASASNIAYPPQTRTPGMVTLDVLLDSSGAVQRVIVQRDLPPLTAAVQNSVQNWKFSPATKGQEAVAGVARISVVFNPFNPGGVAIANQPLKPPSTGLITGVFVPSDVQSAFYALYPPNTVINGAVVLDVLVGPNGGVQTVKILYGPAPLSSASVQAVKSWHFVPGTYEGKAVESHAVVGFVYVPPEIGTM
jgi:outer membrane biosynthesis protein TonB